MSRLRRQDIAGAAGAAGPVTFLGHDDRTAPPRHPGPRIHRAWWVAAVTLGALVAAAGFRSSTGALLEPLEAEFGWSRATTSGAVTAQPRDLRPHRAVRRGADGALRHPARGGDRRWLLVAVGSGLTTLMTAAWQLWLLWGVAVGVGTGAMALVFGAIVANRWFETPPRPGHGHLLGGQRHRAARLPPRHRGARDGTGLALWRAGGDGRAALSSCRWCCWSWPTAPPTWAPSRTARRTGTVAPRPVTPAPGGPAQQARTGPPRGWPSARCAESPRSRVFWILVGTFWICGWSTNGLISTHFIPAAHDHGMPPTTAAGLLALIGVFDIVGTIASGWLTDRVDPRAAAVRLLRVPRAVAAGRAEPARPGCRSPTLSVFIVFYGLDWVATVPPTVALCRTHFGLERSGVVFGWVFAAHMVGAGVAASYAGWVREQRRLLRRVDDRRRPVPGRRLRLPGGPEAGPQLDTRSRAVSRGQRAVYSASSRS